MPIAPPIIVLRSVLYRPMCTVVTAQGGLNSEILHSVLEVFGDYLLRVDSDKGWSVPKVALGYVAQVLEFCTDT